MSSYLNFYLIPKSKEAQGTKPLCISSYSRNDIYQAFYENVNPAFIGNGDESNYTELTEEQINYVVSSLKEDLEKYKKYSEAKIKALKELPKLEGEALEEYLQETTSSAEYIHELENTLKEVEFIAHIISELEYSDFEKVLINID